MAVDHPHPDRRGTAPSGAAPDAVVSGAAAAFLYGLGDLVPEPYAFAVPRNGFSTGVALRDHLEQLRRPALEEVPS